MRISSQEVQAILKAIHKHLPPGVKAQIFLFGSRAQSDLKGGDIDLAVVIEAANIASAIASKDYLILADLKQEPAIGDQKIDLKIIGSEEAQNSFFKQALAKAILLGP
jgi:predicted nucleotidyltransferase